MKTVLLKTSVVTAILPTMRQIKDETAGVAQMRYFGVWNRSCVRSRRSLFRITSNDCFVGQMITVASSVMKGLVGQGGS